MRVLVTGAAGYFASRILPALAADPRVETLVATDRTAPRAPLDGRLRFVRRDLETAACEDLLDEADAVIHLAFRVERRPGEDVTATNLDGNRRFLKAAAERELTLVVASSVAAYGLRDFPGSPLVETDPPAPARGFYYAEHKIAGEAWLDALAPTARARIVRARPSMVGGPTVDPRRALQYRGRLQLIPASAHPPMLQLLHEADLGPAFLTLLSAPAGAYNVAPDDALPLAEAARLIGQRPVVVPPWLARAACGLAWRLGASSLDPAWVQAAAYPAPIADNRKLKSLGWRPVHTTADALRATVAAMRGLQPEASS